VLRELVGWGVPISVDTYKPDIMRRALAMGVDIINDVWALRWSDGSSSDTGVDVLASHPRCGVCLMHMHGDPATMQLSPMSGDVVTQVRTFLTNRMSALTERGVDGARIMLDCGTGFGKTVEQNFELLRHTLSWAPNKRVLAGWSRKSSIGAVTGRDVSARVVGSVVAAVQAVERGATVLRVHDVAATRDGLSVWAAVQGVGNA
jgi:dihydropteroate synthase